MGDKPRNEMMISPDHHVNILREIVDCSNSNEIKHEDPLLHSYTRSFHGFSAMLTEQEAQKLAGNLAIFSIL